MATNAATRQNVGQFRSSVWDPWLIITQILALQGLFYTSLGFWTFCLDWITGSTKSLDQLFKYQSLYVRDMGGTKLVVVFLFNALTCAVGLWIVVQRAKQCLDFTATIHIWHLVACWIYNRTFPMYISWWLLQIVCIVITTVLGEFLCLQSEMRAIPLSLSDV